MRRLEEYKKLINKTNKYTSSEQFVGETLGAIHLMLNDMAAKIEELEEIINQMKDD